MRGALVTLVVGGAAAAAFFGLGFGVQKVGLRPASHSARVGANVAGLILRSRLMASTFTVGGRQQTGLCLHHWFPRQNGRIARGSLLALGNGDLWLQNGGAARFQGPELDRPAYLPRLAFYLAGCTSELGGRVAYAAQLNAIRLHDATLDGRRVLELELLRVQDPVTQTRSVVDRVRLWVDPKTYAPLAVWAQVGKHVGSSRIHLEKLTPAVLHRLIGSVRAR